MILFYVRHGDPDYKTDSLTELGAKQAEAVVARMERCKPDKIYTSNRGRAILTAKPTAERLGLPITAQLEFLDESRAYREMRVTNAEGLTEWAFNHREYQELFNTPEIRALDMKWYEHPALAEHPSFGECMERVQEGTDAFLAELGYRHDRQRRVFVAERPNDDRVAVFAHQGVGLVFLSALLDIPYPQMSTHFDMSHTGITVIHFKGDGVVIPRVLQLSNDSHLFAAGLPTAYHNFEDLVF